MSKDPNAPTHEVTAPADAAFAIVWSRFNRHIVEKLLDGAKQGFADHGVDESRLTIVEVPGAWELPHAANQLAKSKRYAAIVTLGAIIRGGTPHFDFVARGAADGLMQVMVKRRVPVVFGVLTTDSDAQAYARAGGAHGNKGWDAARTAIEMAALEPGYRAHGENSKD